uniref:Fanconi-associated nuclease n=1 Tax=Anisakis simplex TaxID=6269 RepID=A0A0M3JFS6_ANISI
LQTNPADLNFRDLYLQRKSVFDERFTLIENSSKKELVAMMKPVYDTHFGVTNSEISWEVFKEFAQIERFVMCCHPVMLAAVFRRISTDYRNCRSGFPDLTVWNDATVDLAWIFPDKEKSVSACQI